MSENSKALAELQQLEDRIAAHTARLDQLQAASSSRKAGFANLVILIAAVGSASAGIAQFMVPQRSANWAVALGLAGAALCLVAVNALENWSASFDGRVAGLFPSHRREPPRRSRQCSTSKQRAGQSERTVGLLLTGSIAALASVAVIGGVAISVFALLLSFTLLAANRSHPGWAARAVGVATIVVALGASVSLGAWAGTYTRSVVTDSPAHSAMRTLPYSQSRGRVERTRSTGPTAPTYEELCHTSSPFSNARGGGPLAHLRAVWTSAGALVAGCPGPVQDVGAGGTVVASVGMGDGRLQSVGVADRQHGLLLVGSAASEVWPLVRNSSLLGAPTHLVTGEGDIYLVSTTRGTYVIVRQSGATSRSGNPYGEGESDGSYVALSPNAAATWVAAMKQRGGWLWPSRSVGADGDTQLTFLSEDGVAVARGSCSMSRGTCALHQAGLTLTYGPGAKLNISPEEVLELSQQAPNS